MSSRAPIPVFEHPIIETHCHLDYLKEQTQSVIDNASNVGVERIITISVSPDNLETVRTLTQEHETVWGTQGVHPHDADQFEASVLSTIKHNLQAHPDKLIAVGEIGLDYFYDKSDRNRQLDAFSQQLELAAELNLPVVIHTREADKDMQSVLSEHSEHLQRKGVIHSFTSGQALAEFCLSEGFYLGFNGISTFKKAQNVRDIIRITPLEQIVLETDSPYLTPVPYRGKENAPKYLPFIAQQVAECKDVPIEMCLTQCHQNSMALFFN
ncbi:MAG: TatD family hydrolase, partial [Pseudomonadota bacterium]